MAAGNEAIKLCFNCPVFSECQDYKERSGTKHGIWAAQLSRRGE